MNVNQDRAIEILAEEVRKIKDALRKKPDLRQGVVTAKDAGPPIQLTVAIDEGTFPGVRSTDSAVDVDDTVWVLILPGGTRVALGELK